MQRRNRTQLGLGIVLILVAAYLIAAQRWPNLTSILHMNFVWPMWVILGGAALLLIGLLVGAPDMAVPACIVAGVGGILYYCNATENWGAWAYLWTLFPAFGGIGSILAGILGGDFKHQLRGGINSIIVSLVLFTIFATIFDAWTIFGPYSVYVPIVLLFALGLWFLVRGFLRSNK